MFIENVLRLADIVCSRDAPCWRAKSWDITEVKGRKISSLLSVYTEANNIHNRKTLNFYLESVNKK
jgi:hypothetical protein